MEWYGLSLISISHRSSTLYALCFRTLNNNISVVLNISALVQDCSNLSVLAVKLLQSSPKPWIYNAFDLLKASNDVFIHYIKLTKSFRPVNWVHVDPNNVLLLISYHARV